MPRAAAKSNPAPAARRLPAKDFELKEIELHGHRVAYRSAGSGPVIVLVHGITSTSATWERVMPYLATKFTVIAPDLIGHGESAKPRGDYSLGAYASGVRDLMVALGHERATIVGHSLGRRSRHAAGLPVPRALRAPRACGQRRARARDQPAAARRHAAIVRGRVAAAGGHAGCSKPAARSAACSGDSDARGPTSLSWRAATPRWRTARPGPHSCTRCARSWTRSASGWTQATASISPRTSLHVDVGRA